MSKITDIKAKINTLEGGAFQELCDAFLSRKGYEGIHSFGLHDSSMKTTIGNPDTYYKGKTGKYTFVAYTTQKGDIVNKIKEDIGKCIDSTKTGVSIDNVETIIYCHTSSNLSPGEDKQLYDFCASKGIIFDIYGIDRLADEIYRNHKILAKDHLGISVDTNQIMEKRDFVRKYDSNEMMAPLSTVFQFRKNEYNEMLVALEEQKIMCVTGKAGVGKTRLSLEVAQEFGNKYNYKVFCIKSMDTAIYEDLSSYIDEPGKYLFLIDDANELIGLNYILDYVNMQEMGYEVKIITTLRDYVANKLISDIRKYAEPHVVKINRFTDEEIKEFLDVNMGIRNEKYIDAIIRIAEGNPRIAYMAGKLAKEKQSLSAIGDATQLYENYYNRYLERSEITTDKELCLAAGIISLLRTINLSNLKCLEPLFQKINMSEAKFVEMVHRLCGDEYVEIKADKVATISDQCLRNYMLYYAFFYKKVIPFCDLLEIGFRNFRNGTTNSTWILWHIFSSEEVHSYLREGIEQVWDRFKGEEEIFFEFVKYFHSFRPEEVLLIAKKKIENTDIEKINLSDIDFDKSEFRQEDEVLKLLSGYRYDELLPMAIELMCDYVTKKESAIVKALGCLKSSYSIDKNSFECDYCTERTVVDTVIKKRTSHIITKLFLGMARCFLGVWYTPAESGRENKIVMYRIPMHLTEGSKVYRRAIWEELIKLSEEEQWATDIEKIVGEYSDGWNDDVAKEVFEFDREFIIPLIDIAWNKNKIKYGIICKRLMRKWKHYGIDCNNDFTKVFESDVWKIYNIFEDRHFDEDISYEEADEKRKKQICDYATALPIEEIKNVIIKINEASLGLDGKSYEISDGLKIFADALIQDKDKLLYFVKTYFENGNSLDLYPTSILKNLVELYESDFVYSMLKNTQFAQKNLWLFCFFTVLPADIINQEWVNRLLEYIKSDEDKAITISSYRNLRFLDNYLSTCPQIYCQVAEIILQKRNYNTFMVRMYFEMFFNEHLWKPEELACRFESDLDLLRNIYLYMVKYDAHTDYMGKFIQYFISRDKSWLEAYAKYFYENIDNTHIESHDRLSECWGMENYMEIFDYLFDCAMSQDEDVKWRIKCAFSNILRCEKGKKHIAEKQENWVLNIIKTCKDDRKIVGLFEVLSELSEEIRRKAIEALVQTNKDYNLFSKLSIVPSIWSWTGSMIPSIQRRTLFYKSLLPFFADIELLEHRKDIQERIKECERHIKHQEVEELMDSLYY